MPILYKGKKGKGLEEEHCYLYALHLPHLLTAMLCSGRAHLLYTFHLQTQERPTFSWRTCLLHTPVLQSTEEERKAHAAPQKRLAHDTFLPTFTPSCLCPLLPPALPSTCPGWEEHGRKGRKKKEEETDALLCMVPLILYTILSAYIQEKAAFLEGRRLPHCMYSTTLMASCPTAVPTHRRKTVRKEGRKAHGRTTHCRAYTFTIHATHFACSSLCPHTWKEEGLDVSPLSSVCLQCLPSLRCKRRKTTSPCCLEENYMSEEPLFREEDFLFVLPILYYPTFGSLPGRCVHAGLLLMGRRRPHT